MDRPPGTSPVLQREYILMGHNVGWTSVHGTSRLHWQWISAGSRVYTLEKCGIHCTFLMTNTYTQPSYPLITQIQPEKSMSFKVYTQTFTNLNLPRNGLPGWGALMVVQSAVWDVNFWRLLHVSSSSCACSLPFSAVRIHPVWCPWTSRKVHPIELCKGHSLKQMLNLEVWSWSLSLGFRLLSLWPETSRR